MASLKYKDPKTGNFIKIPQVITVNKDTIVDAICDINGKNVYYFSVDGSDNNDGRTPNSPKKSFQEYLLEGNTLLFKAGNVFTLDTPISIATNNLVISSYGNGRAKFSGLHVSENTFTSTSITNLYSVQFDKDIDPGYIVIEDEANKNWKRLSTEPETYNEDEWYFDKKNHVLYYYSSTNVVGKKISYSLGSKGIVVTNSSNITIDNIEVSDFAYHGISLENNVSCAYISNNEVHDIGGGFDTQVVRYGNAIQLWLANEHDIYVEDNIIHDVFDTGITSQGTGSIEDCYNLYIRRNDVRRCAFMLEFFNSTSDITVTTHFEDNFCYQVKDVSEGYRTPNDYTYTHLSFVLVWNSSSDTDKVYFKNNVCIESDYCALAFSQNTVRDKLIFENNLFICDPLEKIHNSYVLDELPEVLSIRNSGLTEDEVNSLIETALSNSTGVSDEQIAQAVSDYLTENPVSASGVECLERIYFDVDGGQYWNKSGELIEYLTKVSATSLEQLIPVSEGEKYRVTLGGIWVGSNPSQVVFFDSDKVFVSVPFNNANVTAKEFTVPSGVSYMGITVWSGVEPVVYRVSTLNKYSKDQIREEHLTRMKHEQNIQHTTKIPYYKTPTKPYITFVHDDCRSVFDVLAQHFIDRNIPLCVATPHTSLVMSASVGDLSMRQVLDNVVSAGGEVLVHHGQQMTQAMLDDYDTCFEHFVTAKKVLEDCGYDINGIILAGGTGQVVGSPISDMWIRSYYLYSDLYGEAEYGEPYHHPRQSLVNLGTFENAKARVQTAIDNNEWLVMYTHDWNDFSEDNLTQLLDWINEQGIAVYTYKQVYDELIAYKGVVESDTSGSIGTTDYEALENLPSINGVTLSGDKTTADLGIVAEVDKATIQNAVSDYLSENPTASTDPLAGKRILFVGDSICYGTGCQYPYPYWVGQLHPTATIINDAVAGQTMAYQTSGDSLAVKCQNDRYSSEEFANADIVVIEGGINDLMRNIKIGTIKTGYMNIRENYYNDNIDTFASAMEYVCKYFTGKFIGKRIIFMTIHRLTSAIPHSRQWAYWECASEVCAKWGVEFVDLYHPIQTELTGSDLHPNNDTHKDWYASILDRALTSSTFLVGSTQRLFYGNPVIGMGALIATGYTTREFSVGDIFSQSDWRINATRADLKSNINVTSSVSWDLSEIPMDDNNVLTTEGTFNAYGNCIYEGQVLDCVVKVIVGTSGESSGDNEDTSQTVELTGIGATKTKTVYNVGDTLDTSDIVVTGTYTDASTKDLTSEATINTDGVDMNSAGTYTINISVNGGYTATISITVSAVSEESNETIIESTTISGGISSDTFTSLSSQQLSYIYITQAIADGSPKMTLSVENASGRWFAWHTSDEIPADGVSQTTVTPEFMTGSETFTDKSVDLSSYVGKYLVLRTAISNNGTFSITYENGDDSNTETDTTTWDDSTTITAAWKTIEGVFSNIEHARGYTEGTAYNVSCKLMAESESTTSGEVILRVDGVQKNLGTINFGEVIEVDAQMTANATWTANGNMTINVYTTSGSGFPWTVYIKDFVITE